LEHLGSQRYALRIALALVEIDHQAHERRD
jgi:hypothetical protein